MTSFNAHKRPRIDRRETMERRRIEIAMYTRARTHTTLGIEGSVQMEGASREFPQRA